MKPQGLNSLLPRITLRLPRIGVFLSRPSVRKSSSSSLLSVLASCGFCPFCLRVPPVVTAAEASGWFPRNRAFPALPLTPFSSFPARKSVLPRITLRSVDAV